MASDLSNLMRRLRRQGFEIDQSGRHLKVSNGDGQMVVMPRSPSDHRALRNTVAHLTRIGYQKR